MRNTIKFLLCCLMIAACAGGEGEEQFDTEEEALGQVAQTFTAKTSAGGTVTFGRQTGAANGRCSSTSTGQVCQMPASKNLTWRTIASVNTTDAERIEVRAKVQAFVTAITNAGLPLGGQPLGWSFTEVAANEIFTIVVNGVAATQQCSGGSSSGTPVAFSCIVPSSGSITNLTESLPGTYQKVAHHNVYIDLGDVKAKGATASEDDAYLDFVVKNVWLRSMGRGNFTQSGANRSCSDTRMSFYGTACPMAASDICSLSTLNQNNTTSFGIGPSGDCGN